MALTGALTADFSDFVSEAQKASAALGVMEAEGKKTGETLAKTGAAIDGVGKSGGGLTELSKGLRTVDASANALGFSLAKPIGAIEEIGQVAGKTTADLGALGTAGAVAGAALAGWSVGRWIADMTGADEIIGRLTANLLGIGDAAEIAAYKQEILAKANLTSDHTITDLNEAMEHNYNQVKKHTAEVDTAIHRQALWEQEIRKHRDILPSISEALANHTATTKQLEKQYGMTSEAIDYYVQKKKGQTAAEEEATRKTDAAAAAQDKLRASMFGTDSITKAQEYVAALGGIENLTRMTGEEQTKLNTVLGEAIASYGRVGEVAPQAMRDLYNATVSIGPVITGLGAEFASLGEKFSVSAAPIIADMQRMSAEAVAYEAETRGMVDAAQQIAPPIAQATTETRQLTVALNEAKGAALSVHQQLQAGMAMMEAYRDAGVATGMQTAMGGYNFAQIKAAGVMPTDSGAFGAAMRSTGNTLTVNVNSTDAQDIAGKLVGEMQRKGVRF